MSKTNSIVEVNGHRYDGLTGKLLNPRKPALPKPASAKKMIDGFVMAKHNRPKVKSPGRTLTKAQALHQRTQRSATLMRKAVKQPAQKIMEGVTKPVQTRSAKPHATRQSRAKTVAKHEKVNRFGLLPTRSISQPAAPEGKLKMSAKATYKDGSVAPRVPSMVTSVSHQKLERMLDEALLRAQAHDQMMKKTGRRPAPLQKLSRVPKWLSFSLALVIVLAAAFWMVWQNLPTVAVHVAAARSHVSATVPSYTPSGYSFIGPIKYDDGQVTMKYKGNDGNFSITQTSSNWTSSTMATNLPAGEQPQTSLVNGTTVYIYDQGNDAAWVNHGVMYNIKNNAHLPSDQILKIVEGL